MAPRKQKEVDKIKKPGQAWSLDIVIAVSFFIGAFIIFYLTIGAGGDKGAKLAALSSDGEKIAQVLTSDTSDVSFVKNNQLDEDKLQDFANLDYQKSKRILGVTNDYCIYFEDEDGEMVNISGITTIGSPDVTLDLAIGESIKCGS